MSKDKRRSQERRWEILRWVGGGRILPSKKGYRRCSVPTLGDRDLRRLIAEGYLKLDRRYKGSVFGGHIRRTFIMPVERKGTDSAGQR